jgi:hypothetical protein
LKPSNDQTHLNDISASSSVLGLILIRRGWVAEHKVPHMNGVGWLVGLLLLLLLLNLVQALFLASTRCLMAAAAAAVQQLMPMRLYCSQVTNWLLPATPFTHQQP